MSTHVPENTNDLPVLDEAQFDAVCGGDHEFEAILAAEFRNSTLPVIAEIAEAITARNPGRISALAHSIKGSSSTLGGKALAHHCRRFENFAGGEPDWALAATLLIELRTAFEQFDQSLQAKASAG